MKHLCIRYWQRIIWTTNSLGPTWTPSILVIDLLLKYWNEPDLLLTTLQAS